MCARKQVSGLEAVIAAMSASGMDENSAEVTTLKGSLAKVKRNVHDILRKELEIELAEDRLQWIHRCRNLRQEVAEVDSIHPGRIQVS